MAAVIAVHLIQSGIIEPDHTAGFCNGLCNLLRLSQIRFQFIIPKGNRSGGILITGPANQFLRLSRVFSYSNTNPFHHLISQRPGNDAGRVIITPDHRTEVKFCPCHRFLIFS